MNDASLRSYELDAERARARLANDLATLRSPATLSAFTEDLKHEALDAKDSLVESAKSKAQSTVNGILEELKAKAAANPAAALAIGAGLAWRFIQHPPIATALVGLGLYSLLRTDAGRPAGGDYLAQGKARLKEQVTDLAMSGKEMAAQASEAAAAKAAELVDAAKDKAQEWGDSSRQAVEHARANAAMKARTLADDAGEAGQRFLEGAQDAARGGYVRARSAMNDAQAFGTQMIADPESRDKLLLGVAGVAVAAALGIACQKRIAENVGSWAPGGESQNMYWNDASSAASD